MRGGSGSSEDKLIYHINLQDESCFLQTFQIADIVFYCQTSSFSLYLSLSLGLCVRNLPLGVDKEKTSGSKNSQVQQFREAPWKLRIDIGYIHFKIHPQEERRKKRRKKVEKVILLKFSGQKDQRGGRVFGLEEEEDIQGGTQVSSPSSCPSAETERRVFPQSRFLLTVTLGSCASLNLFMSPCGSVHVSVASFRFSSAAFLFRRWPPTFPHLSFTVFRLCCCLFLV